MNKKNYVVFKGRRDGILVALNPDCEFSELKDALRAKAREAASFFSDTTTAIFFSGRETTEREETELLEIFFDETQLNISYISSQGTEIVMKHDEPELLREVVMPNLNEVREELELLAEENNTLYHRGSLRSGQAINYAGSVVMIGDVNIGAEIIAEGNVVVLGGVRGLIHAGCSGNPNCFVYALSLTPSQLRISDIISYSPYEPMQAHKLGRELKPALSYIREDSIVIEYV